MTNDPYQTPGADLGAGGAALSDGHYEFTEDENLTIGKTASRTTFWGVVSIITGILSAIGIIVLFLMFDRIKGELGVDIPNVVVLALAPLAFVNLIIGWLYLGCGKAMKAVVETEGNDVELMMNGLDKMAGAFKIEAIVTITAAAIGFVAGLVIATTNSGGM